MIICKRCDSPEIERLGWINVNDGGCAVQGMSLREWYAGLAMHGMVISAERGKK